MQQSLWSYKADHIINVSRSYEEVEISQISANGSLEGVVGLWENYYFALEVDLYRHHISCVELPALNW